jgi:hypothetical protein
MFQYLETTLQPGNLVFASHDLSNQIPVWTSLTTIVGLGPESIGEADILQQFNDTLRGQQTESSLLGFFNENHIKAFIIKNRQVKIFSTCRRTYQNDTYTVCMVDSNE